MSFTGNFKTVAFPDLLQLFATGDTTGTVVFVRGKAQKEIYFKEGKIVGAASKEVEEDFLGNILLRSGRISKYDLQRVIHLHRTDGKKIGQALVQLRLISREELKFYLKQQVEEIIYNLFGWSEGEFVFKEGELPDRSERLVELDIMNIIMESTRRLDEWAHIQKVLPDDKEILRPKREPNADKEDVILTQEEFRVVTLIDGHRSLREVIEVSPVGEFVTSRALYKLISADLVEVTGATAPAYDAHEDESLFWLLLRVYTAAFATIRKTLQRKLGPANRKVLASLAEFKKGIWSYFTDSDHADLPVIFEKLKKKIEELPQEVRALKVIAGLNQILEQQLAIVHSCLGIEIRKQVAGEIRKEVAFPLAERREIDKKYSIGAELYRILKEVKVTTAVL